MLTMAPQGFAGEAAAGIAAREGAAAGDWCAAVAQAAAAQAGLFNTAQLFLCKSSSGNGTATSGKHRPSTFTCGVLRRAVASRIWAHAWHCEGDCGEIV